MPRFFRALIAVNVVMVALDLIWLGVVAQPIYDEALGTLRAQETVWIAAALFYLQYVLVIVFYAVLPSIDWRQAARRGAGIGWLAYSTYELTNWAVIEGWPAILVPIDIVWGLVLTTLVAVAGRLAAGPGAVHSKPAAG
jgi:uncharacterized membrane protein